MDESSRSPRRGNWLLWILAGVAVAAAVGLAVYVLVLRPKLPVEEPAPPPVQPEPAPSAARTPQIPFTDVTRAWGIEWLHRNGAAGEKLLPESGGGGAAFIDYDQDGDPDLLLISGQAWPWDPAGMADQESSSSVTLYRNDGGKFTDVTRDTGLFLKFYGQGAAIGDYDGDGDDDIFLTAVGANHLLRNDGGRFVDVTDETGVAGVPDQWTTSAGFVDYDRDGDLDLFVCNYVRWSRDLDLAADYKLIGIGKAYAPPFNFAGTQSCLYRNDGGRFTDVSADAGIHVVHDNTGQPVGKALGVVFVDYDSDGWVDIFVANDTVRNFLFRNRGDGTFEEVGEWQRFAYDANGGATSAMGIDFAWFRNDNDLSIAIGNFANEMSSFFVLQGKDPVFTDEAIAAGLGGPTRGALTFGLLMADVDLDGRVDLVQANGHLEEEIHKVQPSQQYRQPAQLFWNAGTGHRHDFIELPAAAIGDLAQPIVGRALTSADIDGDGDLDLVLTQVAGPPLLLRNDQQTGHHWLRCQLAGPPGNPRGLGAIVELQTSEGLLRQLITPTRSYLSQVEPVATFGLGATSTVERLTVIWPDGSRQDVAPEGVDRLLTVRKDLATFGNRMNQATAQMENGQFDAAVDLLQRAIELQPRDAAARRNLVRAYLLGGKLQEAADALTRLGELDQDWPAAAAYLSGLLAMRRSEYGQAADDFRTSLAHEPRQPTVHFQLATALAALGQHEQARQEFETAAALDPLHGGAQFQLASYARKRGDREAFSMYQRDYQRIRQLKGPTATDAGTLEVCRFTQPETATDALPTAPPRPTTPPRFTGETVTPATGSAPPTILALAVDRIDDQGHYELLGLGVDGALFACQLRDSQLHVTARTAETLDPPPATAQLLVANAVVDPPSNADEARGDQNEILVLAPSQSWLFRYRTSESFENLTDRSGLEALAGRTGCWVDLDHDGDIDLCTVSANGIDVWQNNGDGRFQLNSAAAGMSDLPGGCDVAAADLDGPNLGVDLVVASSTGSMVLKNQFGGRFAAEDLGTAPEFAASHVLLDDLDNDGLPDIVLVSASKALVRMASDPQWHAMTVPLDRIDAATFIDYDNDGWLDLVICGGAGNRAMTLLWPVVGGQPLPEAVTIGDISGRQLIALDTDADGDSDLLLVDDSGQLVLLRNDTAKVGRQLKLSLNSYVGHPSSIGTRIQVRRDDYVATRWTQRQAPLEIGMGPHDAADTVQTLWPNGVAHNQIDVRLSEAPLRVAIIEFIRTSSCPFLYAWVDGAWEFLTDVIGTAPLNVAVARDQAMTADADEVVWLGPAVRFQREDATVCLRVTTELRETIYLDELRLLAVDHPLDTRVFSLDHMGPSPAEGVGLCLGTGRRELISAMGSDGMDRSSALRQADGHFADTGRVLPPPTVGFTQPLTIEFDFGPLEPDPSLLLALTGWFRFGSSSSNIAASQRSDLEVIWPRLEAEDGEGHWQLVDAGLGFPAGNTKTIICDLAGRLPQGTRRFRLTSSFEVRWDEIALYRRIAAEEMHVQKILPTAAELAWHGFAELRATSPSLPQSPNLQRIQPQPPWFTALPGWCTRFGDVLPLVRASDEQMAVFNGGEGVTATFQLPAAPGADLQRTLLLYTCGWIKECDPNAVGLQQIEPFPGSHRVLEDDWQLRYNTRWAPGGSGEWSAKPILIRMDR